MRKKPPDRPQAQPARKLERLRTDLAEMGRVLVAFSGGVDSTLLLKVASEELGENVLAVIASSETYPEKEIKEAERMARAMKIPYRLIHTCELENPEFTANPPERCYHCKTELFSRLREIAREEGIVHVLDGSNADDTRDFRPGSKAGQEFGVRSPLREAGLTKEDIRKLSRRLGLSTWDKPSLACLSSRFPYNTPIEKESLIRVGQAEEFLQSLGFRQVRVRHYGDTARIEIEPAEMARFLLGGIREKVVVRLKELGYVYVTLDLEGYRTGSMNEPLGLKATG